MALPRFEQSKIKPPIFTSNLLAKFSFDEKTLPFKEQELIDFDKQLENYEKTHLNPDLEKTLITKNEILASFAISKAEGSKLTLQEANRLHKDLVTDSTPDFIEEKLSRNEELTAKDHDKLEFLNIAETFREMNSQKFELKNLDLNYIKKIHRQLTANMDLFKDHLPNFDIYQPGKFRDNNLIRVGNYTPPDYTVIKENSVELIDYLKNEPSINRIALFHTGLYAIHLFNNGNKRVCRILEHLLLRSLGLNKKNLYSTSYYYHLEKDRYYKNLLLSIQRKNFNYFTAFIQESLFLSQLSILKTSIKSQRKNFLDQNIEDERARKALEPLVKEERIQYKKLYKRNRSKMAEQTFVNILKEAAKKGILRRKEEGKAVYYSLNVRTFEEKWYRELVSFAKERLDYIPSWITKV